MSKDEFARLLISYGLLGIAFTIVGFAWVFRHRL